jgi:leucyl/phenylalanyl-tRNA---protein transferase
VKPVPFTPRILEFAYRQGYFPMSDPDTGEIGWYCPDPRAILPLNGFHVSRTLSKRLRKSEFTVSFNKAFSEVMLKCADRTEGSWISDEFVDVYSALRSQEKAHSVEVWRDSHLVGGVYGVALGGAFCAESMFHTETDASKVALYHLVSRLGFCGFTLLEVQYLTPHLESLGAKEIPLDVYMETLNAALPLTPLPFVPAE